MKENGYSQKEIIKKCKLLIEAYGNGKLGNCQMPEDFNPGFKNSEKEQRLLYFTLPMALNYQRNSYKLWQSALATYNDSYTKDVFYLDRVVKMSEQCLRDNLLKHKLALQPTRHIAIWRTISESIFNNWSSLSNLFVEVDNDYTKIKDIIQNKYKKEFPYLSGPKIFNYWNFIMNTYGGIIMKNKNLIEIAPDTHVIKCSVILGVITEKEAKSFSKDVISEKWRKLLENTGINPIDMHSPLWFWSKNNFIYKV